ncbi:MAG: apolipoprotein N-acyltransferase, partial [Planctomycetota bacterium]|nr:apolipoprotein N-acyltransferase [Planctomycetota bacterium]
MKNKKRLLLSLSSAVLLFFAFPPLSCWWVLPVALIPFYIALKNLDVLPAALISYVTGFLLFFLVCFWLSEVTFVGLLVSAFIAAFYYGGFGASVSLFQRQRKVPLPLAAASAWCCVEFLRSKLFWLSFPWALIPHPLYEQTVLMQAADLFGIWGYSLLIPLLNFELAEIFVFLLSSRLSSLKKEPLKVATPITAASILLFFPLYGLIRLPTIKTEPSLNLLLVQGNIPQQIKEETIEGMRKGVNIERILNLVEYMLSSHLALTDKGLKKTKDIELVVWPETMVPGSLFESPDRYTRIVSFVRKNGVALFLGTERRSERKRYNSAVLIGAEGEIKDIYDKMVLVPVGEYVPARKVFPLFAHLIEKMMPYETEDLSCGERMTLFEVNGRRFVCLICFELSFCEIVREAVKLGGEMIVNISNDAWFGRSSELDLAVAQAVFRAVET